MGGELAYGTRTGSSHAFCLSDLPQGALACVSPTKASWGFLLTSANPHLSKRQTQKEKQSALRCGRDPSAAGKNPCLRWCGHASKCRAGPGAEAASRGFGCLRGQGLSLCPGLRLQNSCARWVTVENLWGSKVCRFQSSIGRCDVPQHKFGRHSCITANFFKQIEIGARLLGQFSNLNHL